MKVIYKNECIFLLENCSEKAIRKKSSNIKSSNFIFISEREYVGLIKTFLILLPAGHPK